MTAGTDFRIRREERERGRGRGRERKGEMGGGIRINQRDPSRLYVVGGVVARSKTCSGSTTESEKAVRFPIQSPVVPRPSPSASGSHRKGTVLPLSIERGPFCRS